MYELYLISQLANNFNGYNCIRRTNPIVVCKKTKNIVENKKTKIVSVSYTIKLSDATKEFTVNRCTYLANEVGQPFVFEEDKKWCNKEKQLYAVWAY